MISKIPIASPKKKGTDQQVLYNYYAGYSEEFVRDVIARLDVRTEGTILDPWNGSGTTTEISSLMGYSSIGYDINPVMLIVAKSRLINRSVFDSLYSIAVDIVSKAKKYRSIFDFDNDPLNTWLKQSGVRCFRKIERAIQQLLVGNENFQLLVQRNTYAELSSLTAFYYVAMFKTVRVAVSVFQASNPTWMKTPKNNDEKLELELLDVCSLFLTQVTHMIQALNIKMISQNTLMNESVELKVASSRKLPLYGESVDAIITSPPYCTRIDYATATKPELAVMGFSMTEDFLRLRNQMIGTPTIDKREISISSKWGESTQTLLNKIRNHHTKASETYYFKNFIQYFDSIFASLQELDRVLKYSGKCTMVVQDSYYKDVHVNLPFILAEMGSGIGWELQQEFTFGVSRTMAGINKRVSKYRKQTSASENVLIFRKGGLS